MRKLIHITLAAVILISLISLMHAEVSAQGTGELLVTGAVTSEAGAPLPGVNITALNTTSMVSHYSVVNETGNYSISLAEGTYNITASYANHTANISYTNVPIGPATNKVFNFRMLEILGTLIGHVTNRTIPIQGAMVVLTGDQYNYSANSSLPFGFYVIDKIRPGTYVAHAEKSGYWTIYHDRAIVITRGVITELNFTILEQPTKLSGTVKTDGNVVVRDVQVLITSVGYSTSTVTDANGNYTFSNVPVGTYTLTFKKDGYEEMSVQISLSAFEPKKYDANLDRKPVEGGGGFIPGFDLPHSLMIVGFCLAIAILLFAIYIRYRVLKKPEMLAIEREEEEKTKEGKDQGKKKG
jgi:hypothetical protein